MRVEGAVAAIFISCAVALADDTKPIDFSGDWWNNRCGLATLVEQGSLIERGIYSIVRIGDRPEASPNRIPFGNRLISFVVNFGSNGPITAWVGQHTVERGTEEIITHWYMTIDVPDEKEDAELYKSILAGADVFVRAKPSRCK